MTHPPRDLRHADADEDETTARVLTSAAKLFALHGPRLVTLKWVALESSVPADWIVTRWPSITELLSDVLDHKAQHLSSASPEVPVIRSEDFAPAADQLLDVYDRILVRAILDDIEPALLQSRFPMVERIIDDLRGRGMDASAARTGAFQITLLELGVRLFGPTLAHACGLSSDQGADVGSLVRTLQRTLADPARP